MKPRPTLAAASSLEQVPGSIPKPQIKAARFPDGSLRGTATATYQVGGAWEVDDKGESI